MSYNHIITNLPIHKAALNDDWESVAQIFENEPELMTKPINYLGETPLMIAVGTNTSHSFVKQLVDRIISVGAADQLFLTSSSGDNPLHRAAKIGNMIDAMILVEQNRDMAQAPDANGYTPLTLAACHRNKSTLRYLLKVTRELLPEEEGSSLYTGVAGGDLITLTIQAGFLAPSIKDLHDIKVNDYLSKLLTKCICTRVLEKVDHDLTWKILGSATSAAVQYGTPQVIEECIKTYPDIIWYTGKGFHLSLEAITQRQEQVYNVIWRSSIHNVSQANLIDPKEKENSLHKAAKLAPPHRLNIVTGAALQLQRELQWYKEVENLVEPSYKQALNKNKKTPKETFIEEHKDLLDEAQQWMKDTASSCTVVAALIITMAFAGAFTLPGGNEEDGKPLFLNKGTFMLFIISDAIALFSSTASVLMFLGILTARFSHDDFLYNLPKRMTIGLVSFFVSLAATMIAFSATLVLVLEHKVSWITAPLVVVTCIPVGLFAWLQFPLLIELVYSTYGPSIFRQKKD
ncbi:Ankyrin repeat-containing protein [Artemisia annua]|uniref:Ankyrin repeat-containing protein n=1 Tax=Artemisia annua TaxID=35608 RepID=A0A2U1NQ58_ARTAN|nr:Ankyrin repeat-containing protein [Artemisia annua]